MPIYEYVCKACGKPSEILVRGKDTPACTHCGSEDLKRLLSLPALQTEGTHALAMKAAKKRDKRQAAENIRKQREYELSHPD